MGASTLIPKAGKSGVASFKVTVDGGILPDKFAIASLVVRKSVNKIPVAQLLVRDGDVAAQKFEGSASSFFIPGKKIVIEMGYQDGIPASKKVFEGIIIAQSIKLKNESVTQLVVDIKDAAVKMTVGRKNAYYSKKNDKTIIGDILAKYSGLTPKVGDIEGEEEFIQMVQYFSTDWDFMVSRAEASGRIVYINDGIVEVKQPDLTGTAAANIRFGDNVYEFDMEIDARDEYKKITTQSWDPTTRALLKDSSTINPATDDGNLSSTELADVIGLDDFIMQHSGTLSTKEQKALSNSKKFRAALSKIRGTVKVNGFSNIKLGDIIKLEKFSPRFNGQVFVSGIMHQMSGESTWFTEIQFGFSEEWFSEKYPDIIDRPAAGLLPAMKGLTIGQVIDPNPEDEDNDNLLVKVKIPLVKDSSDGVWAKILMPDAGEKRGIFFRPRKDDEVILGFLDDDPRQPVILGCLHSKVNAAGEPPVGATEDDFKNIKGFYISENFKIEFDEDKKSITIQTNKGKDGNRIILTDTEDPNIAIIDKNENKIEMNKDGIVITSAKHIELKAPKGDIKMEALNIEMAAKKGLKGEGKTTAEISSSGSTTIKGQILKLN
ncbi:MAG: type VI secretion system tip protein VgrG [Bacteroidia bacterium]|nr:type VI secretion system tip protein VgrG [Bacteroidia bacterium]